MKIIEAKRGVELRTHRELWQFVARLRTELKDLELSKLFMQANHLRQNFYEGVLPPEAIMDGA